MREMSREDAEAFGEFAEFGPGPQPGELEEVAGDGAADVVDPGFLRSDPLGFLQGMQGLADLAAHCVRRGQVKVVAGLPFRWPRPRIARGFCGPC